MRGTAQVAAVLLVLAPTAQSCFFVSFEKVVVGNRPSGEVFQTLSKAVKDDKAKLGYRFEDIRKPIVGATVSIYPTTLPYESAVRTPLKRLMTPADTDAFATAVTDEAGHYTFEDLPLGTYEIVVRANGFVPSSAYLTVSGTDNEKNLPVNASLSTGGGECSIVFQPKQAAKKQGPKNQ